MFETLNCKTRVAADDENNSDDFIRITMILCLSCNYADSMFVFMFVRAFFKNSSVGGGGGATTKRDHTITSVDLLVGGGGSGDILPQKIFVFFYASDFLPLHFLKQIFGYTALHYAVDRLNLQLSTCIVCLCRYHNLAVTRGASLINLEGPTPTKRHHGWHRAEEF